MRSLFIVIYCVGAFLACYPNKTNTIFISKKRELISPKKGIQFVSTLQQAIDILNSNEDTTKIRIVLDEGKYLIDKTLLLKNLNRKIVFEAKENGTVWISGEKIVNTKISIINDSVITFPIDKEIYKLVVNGRSISMCSSVTQEKAQYMQQFTSFQNEKKKNTYSAIFPKEEIEKMEIGCYVYIYCKWIHYKLRVSSIDYKTRKVQLEGMNVNVNYVKNNKDVYYSISNSRLILKPGTFCYVDGKIYYQLHKEEKVAYIDIKVPHLVNIMEISNCTKGITISGIHFTNAITNSMLIQESQAGADWPQAIIIKKSKGIIIDNCEFSNNMGYSINIKNNSTKCEIKNCFFHDLGCGAIRVGEIHYPDETNQIEITNNVIKGYGQSNASAVGILVAKANHITITNNTICDGYYTGISLGWTWGYGKSYSYGNYIANNHIHHLMQGLLSDGAGIYTLGNQKGTIIEKNYIHDVISRVYSSAGSSLLYFDEGTSNVIAKNNVCFGSHTGFHEHYGKCNVVERNVFAYTNQVAARLSNYQKDSLLTVKSNTFILDCGHTFNRNLVQYGVIDNNKFWSGEIVDKTNGLKTITNKIDIIMNVKELHSKNAITQEFSYGVTTKDLKEKAKLTKTFLNEYNKKVCSLFPNCSSYFKRNY